jgi:hypothetical protein
MGRSLPDSSESTFNFMKMYLISQAKHQNIAPLLLHENSSQSSPQILRFFLSGPFFASSFSDATWANRVLG